MDRPARNERELTSTVESSTSFVLAEIEIALDHHELIKVKVNAGEREERDAAVQLIAERTASDLINRIGNTAAFFRANPKKKTPMRLPAD